MIFNKYKQNYKETALKARNKKIRKEVDRFKKVAMLEFEKRTRKGHYYARVSFVRNLSDEMIDEILRIVLDEFTKDIRYEGLKFEVICDGIINRYVSLAISCR